MSTVDLDIKSVLKIEVHFYLRGESETVDCSLLRIFQTTTG